MCHQTLNTLYLFLDSFTFFFLKTLPPPFILQECKEPSLCSHPEHSHPSHSSFSRPHPHFTCFSSLLSPVSYPLINKLCVRNSILPGDRIRKYWYVRVDWHLRHWRVTLPFIHCMQPRTFHLLVSFSHLFFHLRGYKPPYHIQSSQ